MAGCDTAPHQGAQFFVVHDDGTANACDPTKPNDDPYSCSYNNSSGAYEETYNDQTYNCWDTLGCDEDHPLAITPLAVASPTVASPATVCAPNWVYDKLVDKGQSWEVASRQEDTNNSSSPLSVTFTATTTKTVTVTDEEQFTANASISVDIIATITAGVKAQINHSVSQSVTVSVGNSPVLSIPPEKTGYANYGVSVQITSGHLYDKAQCEGNQSDAGTDITYVPIAVGRCLWVEGQTPCPSL